jgi:hypothetical protein
MQKDPTQTKEVLPNGIIKYTGRIGQPQEYVEFDPQNTDKAVYIAQEAGGMWYVFKSYPGLKGRVETLAQGDKFTCVKFAEQAANRTLPEFHK